jgi:ABC-type branched-subunit amino acid transport system substrate-binding protein
VGTPPPDGAAPDDAGRDGEARHNAAPSGGERDGGISDGGARGGRAAVGAAAVGAAAARALSAAGAALGSFVRRHAATGRGRALLASVAALLVAVPAGAGLAVAALAGDADRAGAAGPVRVARLGLLAPLSGPNADLGAALRNAVELAVDEADETGAVPGWHVELVVRDDLSRPDGGAAAAEDLVGDDAVVGVVGPSSSTVALAAVPTLAEAGIAVVSPANGRPDLTGHGTGGADDGGAPRDRPYRSYFRLSGTDDLEASAAAEYAVGTLRRSRVAVVDGGPDYGDSIARRFARHAERLGAQVTSVHRVADGGRGDDDSVAATAAAVSAQAPDLVYVAGGPGLAADLRRRLAADLPSIPVLGSDALLDGRYVAGAGAAAEGDVVTDLGAPVSELPAAGAFAAAYARRWLGSGAGIGDGDGDGGAGVPEAAGAGTASPRPAPRDAAGRPDASAPAGAATGGPDADPDRATTRRRAREHSRAQAEELIPAIAAYGYDAARAILRAAAVALPGRTVVDAAARDGVVAAVGRGRFAGVTGTVAFDRWGDPVSPVVTVYTVLGGRFVPLRVVRG